MPKIKLEIKGLDRVKQVLNKIKTKVTDLSPVWPAIREDFYKIEEKRFDSANQGRWRPLSENYAAWKAKHYPGKPIMVMTGDLKKSLTSQASFSIYNPGRRELTLGTKIKYALAQHFGTKERGGGRGQSRLPPRPLISITKREQKIFFKIMDQYLNTMVGKIR